MRAKQMEAILLDYVSTRLSFYESTDHVRHAYKSAHGRELSMERALEIVSNLTQGLQYLSVAKSSSELVRPLLISYGARGLARSLILFKDRSKRECALKPSHGVHEVGWASALGATGTQNLLKLSLRLSKSGTLPELIAAVGNVERIRTPVGIPTLTTIRMSGTSSIQSSTEIGLKDLLLRLPDIVELSDLVFPGERRCYRTFLHSYFSGQTFNHVEVDIHHPADRVLTESDVREIADLSPETSLSPKKFPLVEEQHGTKGWTWKTTDRTRLPFMVADGFGQSFIVEDYPNGLRLSNLTSLFLIAFAAGLLVRYYPTTWFELVRRGAGDSAFPLLNAAVSVAHQRFPELILDEFEDRPHQAS